MINAGLINSVIRNKNKDIKRTTYMVTPKPDEDWSAIEDARDYGVPIKSFFDTRDKLVITPQHFDGYRDKYEFYPWTDSNNWKNPQDTEKMTVLLFKVGMKLREMYDKVVFVHVHGSCKGYLSTYFQEISPESTCTDTEIDGTDIDDICSSVALFVYTEDKKLKEYVQ